MPLLTFSPNTKIKSADINSNFAGLVDGSLLASNSINTSNLVANSVSKVTNVFATVGPNPVQNITAGAGMTAITGASGDVTTSGGDLLILLNLSCYKDTSTGNVFARLAFDGGSHWPNGTGYLFFFNDLVTHRAFTFCGVKTGLAADTYTVVLQMQTSSDNMKVNQDDQLVCTIVELKK